ncbi:hypothetical protein BJV77DRAFT_1159786, partial [Russula vinacea]
ADSFFFGGNALITTCSGSHWAVCYCTTACWPPHCHFSLGNTRRKVIQVDRLVSCRLSHLYFGIVYFTILLSIYRLASKTPVSAFFKHYVRLIYIILYRSVESNNWNRKVKSRGHVAVYFFITPPFAALVFSDSYTLRLLWLSRHSICAQKNLFHNKGPLSQS